MIEIDEFEAAAKRMRIKEEAAIAKRKMKAQQKNGGVTFKEENNPYDSEGKDYDEAAKA